MKYVVKNKRQSQYLYYLGFDYIEQPHKEDKDKSVYVFEKTDLLMDAITFYSVVKDKQYKSVS